MRLGTPKTPGPYGLEPAWRADFLSADECAGMGISLLPALTPPTVNQGLVLNGAQYATVENNRLTPAFLAGVQDELSSYVEFAPTFNWDDASARMLYDSDAFAGRRFYLYKVANPDNRFYGVIASAAFVEIAPANYSAIWRQNQRNRVVVAAKSASTAVYMNGVALVNAAAAVPFPRNLPSGVMIGAATGVTSFFSGTIYDWCLWPRKLQPAEAIQLTTVT